MGRAILAVISILVFCQTTLSATTDDEQTILQNLLEKISGLEAEIDSLNAEHQKTVADLDDRIRKLEKTKSDSGNLGILIVSFSLFLYCMISICFNPFPSKPLFLRVCSASLLKTLREKEKLLITSNLSFSHRVFYHFGELTAISILKIVVCKLFLVGRV